MPFLSKRGQAQEQRLSSKRPFTEVAQGAQHPLQLHSFMSDEQPTPMFWSTPL